MTAFNAFRLHRFRYLGIAKDLPAQGRPADVEAEVCVLKIGAQSQAFEGPDAFAAELGYLIREPSAGTRIVDFRMIDKG
jgi:hypothetical protein